MFSLSETTQNGSTNLSDLDYQVICLGKLLLESCFEQFKDHTEHPLLSSMFVLALFPNLGNTWLHTAANI